MNTSYVSITTKLALWLSALMLLAASIVHAGDAMVIQAGGYVDVASGKVVSPANIVIAGDLIMAVNPASLPPDAAVIQLPGLTVLPGMIDVHTHLSYEIAPGWTLQPVTWTIGELALRSGKNARKTLMAGFTTVRDLGSAGFVDVATMKAVERGEIVGPRIIPVGHSISTTGGHCDTTGFAPRIAERDYRGGVADGVDEVLKAVRYQVKHGMSPLEAVRSATMYSAEALGTPDRGQVKVGLLADLIAVEGNPLEDVAVLQDVRFVMKGGVVYKPGTE